MKKTISLILVLALWASLTAFAWMRPADAASDSERRPLAQFPELSADTLLSGQFMKDFADYALDQFPLRDSFRTLNAYLTYYLLGQTDNNGIYLHDGYAAKMDFPMDEASVSSAMARLPQAISMRLPPRQPMTVNSFTRPISPVRCTWVPQQAHLSKPGTSTIRTGQGSSFFVR